MSDARVVYTLRLLDPGAHHFRVSVQIAVPAADGQCLSLPAWIPGSYLVRDYARHVLQIEARCAGRQLAVSKIEKSTWQVAPCDGVLIVTLLVYANDLSVRGAHFDTTHAYFNGVCVFPRVHGADTESCELVIEQPDGEPARAWRVATAMRRAGAGPGDFGRYCAADYDELIDHPVEIGSFTLGRYEACGVPHEIAITGRHGADMDRLCRDLSTLCEQQIRLFGAPPPIDRYLFLVTAVGDGYGGLEHRWSSSLMCRRDHLPLPGRDRVEEGYRGFLGLCSHEYFHLWNVKRMRPAAFASCDLSREAQSALLWVFEGITSYYDDLALVRSGLIERPAYLELVGNNVTRVLQSRGRLRQSLADSSIDAWIKLYKRDENSPNAIVSYYTKGALVALALDLTIRRDSAGVSSLDDVMRAMWRRYGENSNGLPEDGFEALVAEVTGLDLRGFFARAVRGTEDIDIKQLLQCFGVTMTLHPEGYNDKEADKPQPPSLQVALRDDHGRAVLATVYEGGPAHLAGLSADDELLAIDDLRVAYATLDAVLATRNAGDTISVDVFRRDELMRFSPVLDVAPDNVCKLALQVGPDSVTRTRCDAWLTGDRLS